MLFLGLALVVLILCFGLVVLFGAPYVPTLTKHLEAALDLTNLTPGETLIELGCGDGKVVLAAAKRGWNVVGYELNPLLVIVSYIRTWHYRTLVTVRWGNFWKKQWPPADAIFVFTLPKYMPKLSKKVMQSTRKPVKLVSFAFEIPDKKPISHKDSVYLYIYE